MTDEQFEKFLAVQVAQLAMLQGIYRNSQVAVMAASKATKPGSHHWGDLAADLQQAIAIVKNL